MTTQVFSFQKLSFSFLISIRLVTSMEQINRDKISMIPSRSFVVSGWETGNFGTYWKFKFVSQLSNDRNAYPETIASGGMRHSSQSLMLISSGKSKVWLPAIWYGRRTGRMADEWQVLYRDCLELFANKLWLYDKKGTPWPLRYGQRVAIPWHRNLFRHLRWLYWWLETCDFLQLVARDFSEGNSYELLEYWLSYYKQDDSISEDRGRNDWALALVGGLAMDHGFCIVLLPLK